MFSPRHCGPTLPDQIDGLPAYFYPDDATPAPIDPSARQAAIDEFFDHVPADVRHGGDRAFFHPTFDFIQMPHRRSFTTMDHYASVRAHEVCNIASVLISRTVDGLCALLFPNHRTACCAISGRES